MENKDLSNSTDGHTSTVTEPGTTEKPSVKPDSPLQNLPKLLFFSCLGMGLIVLSIFAYRWWEFNTTHQETDDAYVTSDIHPITARISGTVTQVNVQDNQLVSAGTNLVQLESPGL